MNVTRTAILACFGAVLAAWLAGAATSSNRGPIAPSVARTPLVDMRGAALAEEVARLHDHLRPSAVPQQPGRNLFSFSTRPAPVALPLPAPPKAAVSESVATRPAAPAMKLSGIAEDVTERGVVRTAIISAFGQLFLAKEGDAVTDRYRVVKISSDVAELSDLTDGAVLRIALK
jgi:hypothetical protein